MICTGQFCQIPVATAEEKEIFVVKISGIVMVGIEALAFGRADGFFSFRPVEFCRAFRVVGAALQEPEYRQM